MQSRKQIGKRGDYAKEDLPQGVSPDDMDVFDMLQALPAEQRDAMVRILWENRSAFLNSPNLLDFEREWMENYVCIR